MIDPKALLDWYADAGVTTAESAEATNLYDWPDAGFKTTKPKFAPPLPPREGQPAPPAPALATPSAADYVPTDEAVQKAKAAAAAATSIEDLAAAIKDFDGCPLKEGARNTVVYDGIPKAPLLIIGEAPGRDEDRVGKPFVGRAGGLLDQMLAAIGHSRLTDDELEDVCITNAIYWRPPGNRTPTKAEIEICLPFVRRFIELSAPKAVLLTGNVPTQALFDGAPGITRARGTWRDIELPGGRTIPALPVFHPAFLLRQPAQKRLAWADFLALTTKLSPR